MLGQILPQAPQPYRTATAYAADHFGKRLRHRPVAQIPRQRGPDAGAPRAPVKANHGHLNWVPEDGYALPADRFNRSLGADQANVVELVRQAALAIAVDQVAVVRPVGSLTYARTAEDLHWDLVRDLDLWVYVSKDTVARDGWLRLHQRLQTSVYETARSAGVWVSQSQRTGYVYLHEESGQRRMIELKIADLDWLETGLWLSHRRRPYLTRGPQPAHFDQPRVEWAGYTPFENYFPTPAAAQPFDGLVRRIRPRDIAYAAAHVHAENLAEAMSALTPTKMAAAAASRRHFFRYSRRVVKKQLMLAVLHGQACDRDWAVEQLLLLRSGDGVAHSRSTRVCYVAARAADLSRLASTDPLVLQRWCGGQRPPGFAAYQIAAEQATTSVQRQAAGPGSEP